MSTSLLSPHTMKRFSLLTFFIPYLLCLPGTLSKSLQFYDCTPPVSLMTSLSSGSRGAYSTLGLRPSEVGSHPEPSPGHQERHANGFGR